MGEPLSSQVYQLVCDYLGKEETFRAHRRNLSRSEYSAACSLKPLALEAVAVLHRRKPSKYDDLTEQAILAYLRDRFVDVVPRDLWKMALDFLVVDGKLKRTKSRDSERDDSPIYEPIEQSVFTSATSQQL